MVSNEVPNADTQAFLAAKRRVAEARKDLADAHITYLDAKRLGEPEESLALLRAVVDAKQGTVNFLEAEAVRLFRETDVRL